MNTLEVYINEVERQLDRKVKIVKSDRGGEYYGKYDESGQHPGLSLSSLRDVVFVLNTQCLVKEEVKKHRVSIKHISTVL